MPLWQVTNAQEARKTQKGRVDMDANADSSNTDLVVVFGEIGNMRAALAAVDNERIVRIVDPNTGFGIVVDRLESCCTLLPDD